MALLTVFQRNMMYFPAPGIRSPAAAGAPEMQPVTLQTADGLALTAWYAPPATARDPVLVYLPGNGANRAFRALLVRPYLDAGIGVLLLDWRGYGGNPGRPTRAGLFADGAAAVAHLQGIGIARARIVLYGESLGGAVAVQLAADAGEQGTPFAGVVLDAPFTSAADLGRHHLWWLPVGLVLFDRYDNLPRIARIGAPLLVVHGTDDFITPLRFGAQLFAVAAEPKQMVRIEGGGHEGNALAAAEEILRFLRAVRARDIPGAP